MSDFYRASSDVLAAPLERDVVLLHIGRKRYYRLNATGAAVWDAVVPGATRESIVDTLHARYDVDPSTLATETDALLDGLVAQGLITRATSTDA